MIREALELLSRPLRRRLWESHRTECLTQDPPSGLPPGAFKVPVPWVERTPEDVKQDVHRWFAKKFAPQTEAMTKADAFLRRVKKDLKKKRFVDADGRLDMNYHTLSEEEDRWVDVDNGRQVRLSEILDYYRKHCNPLASSEDVSFHGRGEAADRFWKAHRESVAIAFYKEETKEHHSPVDLFEHFGMNDDD